MKKIIKNKGFTLVELLAVIAILAILVIMALPAVLRMYRQSRINNFQNEVRSTYRTAQSQFLGDSINLESGEKILYTNADSCTPTGVDSVKALDMTGNTDFKYYVLINVDGKVLNVRASNGTYSFSKQALDTDHDLKIEDIDVETNNDSTLDSGIIATLCPTAESAYIPVQPLEIGEEVIIGSEHFYVISSDLNETVLLAKYNLLVGDVYTCQKYNPRDCAYKYSKTLKTTDSGYGLQSSTAISKTGVVPFSGTNYWDNSVYSCTGTSCSQTGTYGLKSKYAIDGAQYGQYPWPYVYESSLSTIAPSISYTNPSCTMSICPDVSGYAQNNGYTIAYYVESYVNRLKALGAPSNIQGRLLSYDESLHLPRNLDISGSFWLGTAGGAILGTGNKLWSGDYGILYFSHIGDNSASYRSTLTMYASLFHVHPVIVVSTSDL